MKHSGRVSLHIIVVILVLIGSINWGLVAIFDYDFVKDFSSLFGSNAQDDVSRFLYILVAMAAFILLFNRNIFLPFLGESVIPQPLANITPIGDSALKNKVIKGLPSKVKVLYWASLPSDKVVDNPTDAYGNYSNQGVTTSDENGVATLQLFEPSSYKVPIKGTLKPHVHYRYWNEAGIASPVFTVKM